MGIVLFPFFARLAVGCAARVAVTHLVVEVWGFLRRLKETG